MLAKFPSASHEAGLPLSDGWIRDFVPLLIERTATAQLSSLIDFDLAGSWTLGCSAAKAAESTLVHDSYCMNGAVDLLLDRRLRVPSVCYPRRMRSSLSDPPVGSTLSAIRAVAPSLALSERRVADLCVDQPHAVAWWSVVDVATRAGTSTATVIRACQSLGFTGFQHLRSLLLRDLGAAGTPPSDSPSGNRDDAGRLYAVFAEVATDVSNALAPLDEEAFDRAARALASADRVLVVGNGGSGLATATVAMRFILNGQPVEAPTDAVIQQLAAAHLTPRDVFLAVSDSGANSITVGAVESARAVGATIIGVTSYAHSTLAELSDISLVIGGDSQRQDKVNISTVVIQVAFLISLQIAVCRLQGANSRLRPSDKSRFRGREQ